MNDRNDADYRQQQVKSNQDFNEEAQVTMKYIIYNALTISMLKNLTAMINGHANASGYIRRIH